MTKRYVRGEWLVMKGYSSKFEVQILMERKIKIFYDYKKIKVCRFQSLFVGVTFLKNLQPRIPKALIQAKNMLEKAVFLQYSRFLSPQIVKTANTKSANNEGRQY